MIEKAELFDWNVQDEIFINTLINMRARGLLKVNDDGKFEILHQQFDDASNYIFFNVHNCGRDDCILWHDIMWNQFKEIAPTCLHCWKVVGTFPTVADLYKFYKRVQSETEFYGKCGYDSRKYTKGFYKAFIYNDTLEEAQRKYEELLKIVPKPEYLIIKRGCTEFENALPSPQWALTEKAMHLEEKILELIEPVPHAVMKPWMEKKIYDWFRFAAAGGDLSYKSVIKQNFEPWVHSIEYHNKPVIFDSGMRGIEDGKKGEGNLN